MEIAFRIVGGVAMAWLWRQGGKGNKYCRTYIAPVLSFILTRNIAVALMVFGMTRLPPTLIGDKLKPYGQLFWWIPILCFLHAVPVFLTSGLWVALGVMVIQYLMILGSNLVNFPKWNWYETIYGFMFGVMLK